jgi:phage terminase large subunit GpA-like protein
MDAFNDPSIRRVIGMFSAQTTKTTIIENVVGYHAHHDPCPIMVVQPQLDIGEAFSKDRISPMIRDTPALKRRFASAGSKSSGDTLLHKKFPGGHLTIAGANSANSLASRPIRILIGDEAAKWKANDKGSPFRQSAARVKGFWNSKIGYFSTPTDAGKDNEFNQIWDESDKRLFLVPCPECEARIVLAFDDAPGSLPTDSDVPRGVLRWQEGTPTKTDDGRNIRRADSAWFECLSCGCHLSDVARYRAVRKGEWLATSEFHGTAGFWGWQGISPFSSALDIANEWLGALGSLAALKSVKNETLGLPFTEAGEAHDWKRLFDRRDQAYELGAVPRGALILTTGVDVQQDRLEVHVVGWGRRRQCWLVDYIVIPGDVFRPEVWAELTVRTLGAVYSNEDGADFTTRRLAIDSGFATSQVYEWARQHRFGVVSVVKGGPESQTAIVAAESPAEITVNGRRMNAGVKIQNINVSRLKEDLYGRLGLPLPNIEKGEEYPDGFFHFCALPDTEEYCRQLTAEQRMTRITKSKTERVWEKTRPRNEALDTWNYAAAARIMIGVDRYKDAQWSALEAQLAPREAPAADFPAAGVFQQQRPQLRLGGFSR